MENETETKTGEMTIPQITKYFIDLPERELNGGKITPRIVYGYDPIDAEEHSEEKPRSNGYYVVITNRINGFTILSRGMSDDPLSGSELAVIVEMYVPDNFTSVQVELYKAQVPKILAEEPF